MAGQFLVRKDITSLLNIESSETTQPSSAEIESIILDIENEVIGSINVARLAVPTKALNPISYTIVHNIVLWGSAATVQAAYAGNVAGLTPRESLFWGRYHEGMTKIENSPRYLSDATDLTSEADTDIRSTFLDGNPLQHALKHEMGQVY